MELQPSLDRIIVGLAPEPVWAWIALFSSVALSASCYGAPSLALST